MKSNGSPAEGNCYIVTATWIVFRELPTVFLRPEGDPGLEMELIADPRWESSCLSLEAILTKMDWRFAHGHLLPVMAPEVGRIRHAWAENHRFVFDVTVGQLGFKDTYYQDMDVVRIATYTKQQIIDQYPKAGGVWPPNVPELEDLN